MASTLSAPTPLEEVKTLTPEIESFLQSVTWGTEGALYSLPNIREMLSTVLEPTFWILRKELEILAIRWVLEKKGIHDQRPLHCFYHSFFSVSPRELGKGYGRTFAQSTRDQMLTQLKSRGLIYSHVEQDNHRSGRIHEQLGYERVGKFESVTFNRVWPRARVSIQPLPEQDQWRMVRLLNAQYQGHALTDFETSLIPQDYFVVQDRQTVLAGVQAHRQRWRISHLSGWGGQAAVQYLPQIPFLRDTFNPDNFEFLKISTIYFRPGQAATVFQLIEGLLARQGLKTALMFWDPDSPVQGELLRVGRLGFLNALTRTPVDQWGCFKGFHRSEIDIYSRRPKVISPLDL